MPRSESTPIDLQIKAMFSSRAYKNYYSDIQLNDKRMLDLGTQQAMESMGLTSAIRYLGCFDMTQELGNPLEESETLNIWDVGSGYGLAISELSALFHWHNFTGITPNLNPPPKTHEISVPIIRGRVEQLEELFDKGRRPDLKGKLSHPDVIYVRNVLHFIRDWSISDKKNLGLLLYQSLKSLSNVVVPGGRIYIFDKSAKVGGDVVYPEYMKIAEELGLESEVKPTRDTFGLTYLKLTK